MSAWTTVSGVLNFHCYHVRDVNRFITKILGKHLIFPPIFRNTKKAIKETNSWHLAAKRSPLPKGSEGPVNWKIVENTGDSCVRDITVCIWGSIRDVEWEESNRIHDEFVDHLNKQPYYEPKEGEPSKACVGFIDYCLTVNDITRIVEITCKEIPLPEKV